MQVSLRDVAPATVLNTETFKIASMQTSNIISLQIPYYKV